MGNASIYISLAALGVSFASFAISYHRAEIDRRLQWEQMRGGLVAKLTSRGVDVVMLMNQLQRDNPSIESELLKKLLDISKGLVEIRDDLEDMTEVPMFSTSRLLTKLAPIKSTLDDSDPVFQSLKDSINSKNYSLAAMAADGLVARLYGSQRLNAPAK